MSLGDDRLLYRLLVAQFREMTSLVHDESRRCCRVVRDGAPECCFQIADGAELTFTDREAMIVGWPHNFMVQRPDEMWVLDRKWWTPEKILVSTHVGTLANTLECASYPTCPVVAVGGEVVGVVVINGCNADIGLAGYVVNRDRLLQTWQRAVDLTGTKPYYGRPGELKADWTVL